MTDVFISYSRDDLDFVKVLVRALKRDRHLSVWWDQEGIDAGDEWPAKIQRALDQTQCVVVVWSKTAVNSTFVAQEAAAGRERAGNIVVPIKIDSVRDDHIPAALQDIHYIDMRGWSGSVADDRFKELFRQIDKRTSDPQTIPHPKLKDWLLHLGDRIRAFLRGVRRTLMWAVGVAALAGAILLLTVGQPWSTGATGDPEYVADLAIDLVDSDPELSLLLSLESLHLEPTLAGRNAVLAALGAEPGLLRGDPTGGVDLNTVAVDGSDHVAVGDGDGNVQIWDSRLETLLRELNGAHSGSVLTADFQPNGALLATAGSDHVVRLWDAGTGDPEGALDDGGGGPIWGVAFTSDGALLATAGGADGLAVWDVAGGRLVATAGGAAHAVAWSADDGCLAFGSGEDIVVWDAAGLSERVTLDGSNGEVRGVAFHPSDPSVLVTGSADGTVTVWDLDVAAARQTFSTGGASVAAVAVNPIGTRIAAAGGDGWIRVWELDGDRFNRQPARQFNHRYSVESVAFTSPSRLVSAGTDGIRIWDTVGTDPLAQVVGESGPAVWAVATAPSGELWAAGHADGTVTFWDGATPEPPTSVESQHREPIRALAFHPEEPLLASGDGSGLVQLWDTERMVPTGEAWRAAEGVRTVAFSPRGSLLAVGTDDGGVTLVGPETPASGVVLVGHEGAVRAVAFSDSGVLASAGDDGVVNLWDVETAELDGAPLYVGARVWGIAFNPDGSQLATVGDDNRLLVWDVDTRAVTHRVPLNGRGFAATWDDEGRTIVIGSGEPSLVVWDVEWAGDEGAVFVAHSDPVRAVAAAAGGWTLISGSSDGSLAVWNFTAGNLARVSCEVLGRNMTQAEWDQYGSGDYVRHCQNRPSGEGAPNLVDNAEYD